METITKCDLKVQTSPDKVQAWIVFLPEDDYSNITDLEIFEFLKQNKISVTDSVRKNVAELVNSLHEGNTFSEPYLIAEGKSPINETGQEFVWDKSLQQKDTPADENESVNFYKQCKLVTVEAGQIIGTISKGTEGQDGIDVYGNPMKPAHNTANIKLGENVQLDDDETSVLAKTSGQAIFKNNKISVRNVLEIQGNVDFETGNIDAASDVLIRGIVKDLFIVKSKKNISVGKLVEAAYIFADEDIEIFGGVKGREKAIIEAKGNITVKFLEYAYVEAGGNVEVAKEVMDSTIMCRGNLNIKNGALIAGQAYACQGSVVKTLGSPSGVKIIIGIASNPFVFHRLLEIDQLVVRQRDFSSRK